MKETLGYGVKRSNTSFDLLAIGNITLDHICRVDRIPKKGETALVLYSTTHFGGRGANVAFISSRLGLSVALASITGREFIKGGYRDFLARNRVNLDKVKVSHKRECASIELFYSEKGDMIYFFHPIHIDSLTALNLHANDIRKCKALYLTPFNGEKCFEKIFLMARKAHTVFVALGEEVYRKSTKFLESAIGVADYLFLNQGELELLMKKSSFSNIQDLFTRHKRLNCLAVTIGHIGSILYTRTDSHKIPPVIPQRIVNSLGAGDAYVAGFIYGLLRGNNIEKCGKIASVVASFALQEEGAQPEKISADRVQKRYCNIFQD